MGPMTAAEIAPPSALIEAYFDLCAKAGHGRP